MTRTAGTVTPMLQVGACSYCAYITFSCFSLQGAHPHAPSDERPQPAGGALATASAARLAREESGGDDSGSALPGAEAAPTRWRSCALHMGFS